MADITRPALIDEATWEAATDGQRVDWALYAKDIAHLSEDARFQRVVGRWLDEICNVGAGTLEDSECALVRADLLMMKREGRRAAGIEITRHLQAVAPQMWMRLLHELNNARTRAQAKE